MSRTAFAARFRRLVGSTPLDTSVAGEMTIARTRAQARPNNLDGYRITHRLPVRPLPSGIAFKRRTGQSPGRFRERAGWRWQLTFQRHARLHRCGNFDVFCATRGCLVDLRGVTARCAPERCTCGIRVAPKDHVDQLLCERKKNLSRSFSFLKQDMTIAHR